MLYYTINNTHCDEQQRRARREDGHTECAECGVLIEVCAGEAAAGFVCAACAARWDEIASV